MVLVLVLVLVLTKKSYLHHCFTPSVPPKVVILIASTSTLIYTLYIVNINIVFDYTEVGVPFTKRKRSMQYWSGRRSHYCSSFKTGTPTISFGYQFSSQNGALDGFKMHQNRFLLGAYNDPPDPVVGRGGDTPSAYPSHLDAFSASVQAYHL